ncbi:MAG: nitrite/sulfite reductase [Deltaproteobacteria bacterium]|nr:nitrite/sulfite reductase [Deltaproteobacteria bacterium]
MPADWAREIDVFETQMELKKQGKLTDQLFAETRLRRGAYGQRYDNGQRHDGTAQQTLNFPSQLTKGPETMWDAPGMLRIKIPFGGVTPTQLEVLADLAEEYSDDILHITTRQDVQLHYIHIEDTPDIMRRLAAVGITTREACGNSVRNVTACPLAGVCRDEDFDVSPYAQAMMRFMLGHPDTMDFGRKFKIAFSGCAQHACGLTNMHDLGLQAVTRTVDGTLQRGFRVFVGGGLGAVPHPAKLYDEFVTEAEILPVMQAIARVFARLGEKRNRARARVKFLVKQLGIDEFKRLVIEERAKLPHDPRWTAYIATLSEWKETPLKAGAVLNGAAKPEGFDDFLANNVYQQRQPGYCVVTVALPLGDLTSDQTRKLADIARKYVGESLRTTVDQNIVLRWVRGADLPALYEDLRAVGLGATSANTIVDVTSCPGTDTCKLGIASSRGLAGELRNRLAERAFELDAAVRGLHIKISGCFNSCGQHHVADLGFYGVSRQVAGYQVPHFQVVLGGQWANNGGSYGLPIGAIPSKNIPAVVDRLTSRFVSERQGEETFQAFCQRIGKKELKATLDAFSKVPAHDADPSYYSDWGDPREFTTGDMGTGECAGEVVSLAEFGLADAEREVFEAQLALEAGDAVQADKLAYGAMLQAATALLKTYSHDVPSHPAKIVAEFKTRFVDTELFFDKFAKGMVSGYLFRRFEEGPGTVTKESAHQLVEEASLFVEAGHACQLRMAQQKTPTAPAAAQVVSLDLA